MKCYMKKYTEKFRKLKNDDFYKAMLTDLKEVYDKNRGRGFEALPYSVWKIFSETGSRNEYQRLYFARRGELAACAVLYLVYGGEEYKKRLEDIIWIICDEYSWALPAHVPIDAPLEWQQTCIDLFAAETGQALSEVYNLIGGELSDLIRARIKAEVERRILSSFENNYCGWVDVTNNWAAVCAAGVGMSFMYMAPERFESVKPRILTAMENFLSGYGNDGICKEGYGYWKYGFGYFVCFADMYKEFTSGREDLFDNEKVKKIAECQQHFYLRRNIGISVSDAPQRQKFELGITHCLAKRFDSVIIPSGEHIQMPSESGGTFRFAKIIRDFAWSDSALCERRSSKKITEFFEDAQWYICKKEKFSFAAKGGTNDEPHNHNDIGSFIIADDSGQLLADIGSGEYTKDYFTAEGRYKYFCCSSLGHSVPIIDNCAQKEGNNSYAEVTEHSENVFELIIKGVYGAFAEVKRRFEISDGGVVVKDRFIFNDNKKHSMTERFVTFAEPVTENGAVKIGAVKIICGGNPTVTKKTVKTQANKRDGETVYIIDYGTDGTAFEAVFEI